MYQTKQLVHIEPWTLIDVNDSSLGYNPNEELDWRNQPAAVTDCVLNFKVLFRCDKRAFLLNWECRRLPRSLSLSETLTTLFSRNSGARIMKSLPAYTCSLPMQPGLFTTVIIHILLQVSFERKRLKKTAI